MNEIIYYFQFIAVFYFLGLNSTYLVLILLSTSSITSYLQRRDVAGLPDIYEEFSSPVSILVPAYNEEDFILETIESLLKLDYPEFEIIIINDGSTDRTLDILKNAYSLRHFPEAYRVRLPTRRIRGIYHSTTHQNIRLIDKENGDRADALNSGINISRYPLFCCIDADCIIQSDSLRLLTQPFYEDPTIVACGGTIRVSNDCEFREGKLIRPVLSSNPLVLFQTIEYLRSFLFGRMGWTPINAQMIISGAFGLFHKETVVSVGGYRKGAKGEDMELVMLLHKELSRRDKPYRIHFIPDPICWTDVPDTYAALKKQRIHWHKGHMQALAENIRLMFNYKAKAAGLIAFPFSLIFEGIGPVIEFIGYFMIIGGFLAGIISPENFLLFLLVAIGLGVLLSTLTLLLEEISFHIYPKSRHVAMLFAAAILENFGYRQLNTLWRVQAIAEMGIDCLSSLARKQRSRITSRDGTQGRP